MGYAIRVEGLGKRYDINRGAPSDSTLRESLGRGIGSMFGFKQPTLVEEEQDVLHGEGQAVKERPKEYWALKNVSFDVVEGERVGVIGANGAGKSTLLKILSRVTAPTEGRIEIYGKVASLLEVGTGFHPELSGRENIFLSGAILGMSMREIRRKFDQIVAFSGVENFIDTPVKFYSSGMYVRLAFSVSAWLDPDILIVDEVLAVGDQAFQKKCAERIKELTQEGRTVLFVSHSMGTVNQMCQKVLYLEQGQVVSYGPVVDGTVEYHRNVLEQIEIQEQEEVDYQAAKAGMSGGPKRTWRWHRPSFELPDPSIEILTDNPGAVDCISGWVRGASNSSVAKLPISEPVHITANYRINRQLERPIVPSFNFYDEFGTIMMVANASSKMSPQEGEYAVTCTIPPFLLNAGRVVVNLNLSDFLSDRRTYFAVVSGLRFEIVESELDPWRHGWSAPLPGFFRGHFEWSYSTESSGDEVP